MVLTRLTHPAAAGLRFGNPASCGTGGRNPLGILRNGEERRSRRERRPLCDLRFLILNLGAWGNGSGNSEGPAVENGLALILAFYPKEKESNPRITNGLRD